jgi:hypothetical protein
MLMSEKIKLESLLSKILGLGSKVKSGEEIEVFVPYYRYAGPIKDRFGSKKVMNTTNMKGDYIKLKGYRGTFLIDSVYDMGYSGGEILTLKRERAPLINLGRIKNIRDYKLFKE